MSIRLKVGTANTPNRLAPHKRFMKWMEDNGADIVLLQENTDSNDWRPNKKRWGKYRPKSAQSNTIYWRKSTIQRTKKRGTERMSSPGFRSYRDLVWAHFRVRSGKKPVRVAGIHLPAFYTSSAKNKREYDKQVVKVAEWVAGGKNRVIGGDFNGSKGGARMKPIEKAAVLSKPVASGPSGQKIDYVGAKRGGTWKVVGTKVGPKFDSDHNVVLVTLEWVG
jgi:endonuclease/exonuclease/phosphatase family metal-dependent hydrolase